MKYVYDFVYKNYIVYNSTIFIKTNDYRYADIERTLGINYAQLKEIMKFRYLFFYNKKNFSVVDIKIDDEDKNKYEEVTIINGSNHRCLDNSGYFWEYDFTDSEIERLVKKFSDDIIYQIE